MPEFASMTAIAWCTSFSILVIRRVSRRIRFLVRRCQAAAANSGNSIFLLRLLGTLVGCWSEDWRLLLVPMDGGAASAVFFAVFERVLADGGSSLVTASCAARRRRRAFRLCRVLVLSIRGAAVVLSSCVGDAISATLGSDGSFCWCLFHIDRVIGPSTLGSACSRGG